MATSNNNINMDPPTSKGSSRVLFITRLELWDIMTGSQLPGIEEQFLFLSEEVQKRTKCNDEENIKDISKKLGYFKSEFKSRWAKSSRTKDRFKATNINWLDTSIQFPCLLEQRRGRPMKTFDASAERTKRHKTKILRESVSTEELSYATQMSLRASGNTDASNIVKDITTTSPKRASRYRKSYIKSLRPKENRMSGEEALAVFVDAKLSSHQYNVIRMSAPDRFPSYKVVQEEKKKCYPKQENIKVSATSAQVTLQALLDHTVQRLLMTVNSTTFEPNQNKLCLYSKWGFDGSSGHSSYKQAFHGSEASDAAVFITSLVPLRLECDQKLIWENPRPSSTRYCRPLKIEFIKETTEITVAEKERVDEEIKQVRNSKATVEEKSFEVEHKLIFAMIDGKVCNAITGTTSTQKCYICDATSKSFNSIDEMIQRKVKTENLEFGLSILHGWIRFFECLLHLAYKLPIKKWQARGEEDKQIVAENKARIQREFKEKSGLIVDKPKPGFGNSNDGNTARRFFKNAEISSEITKVDLALIKKMHSIMIVVSSGHKINVEKFRNFSHDTARYFVEKYPWYCMPPTLHKFFIHGPEIISSALLPIGQLSEEAQEARNKDFKKFREHFSRKCSREKCNEDILNLFLISSDPVITNKRKLPNKKIQSIPNEALDLLELPSIEQVGNLSDDPDDHDDDDEQEDDDDEEDNYNEEGDDDDDDKDQGDSIDDSEEDSI